MLDGLPIRDAIRPSGVAGLDILTGSMRLASADLALFDVKGREAVLKAAFAPIQAEYDFIILDCPPSLGLLTVNALITADYFLVPVTPDFLALEGLVNLMEAVERIKTGIGKTADLLGFLLTLADYRLNVTTEISDMIRRHYGRAVFDTVIPGNVRLKEAPSFGQTIFDYDAESAGAEAYEELVGEVLDRLAPPDNGTPKNGVSFMAFALKGFAELHPDLVNDKGNPKGDAGRIAFSKYLKERAEAANRLTLRGQRGLKLRGGKT